MNRKPADVTPTEVAATATAAVTTTTSDLKTLMDARKVLDEQIRAAKAANPQASALDRVVARQVDLPKWLPANIAARVVARVRAGQSADAATDAVFAQIRAAVEVLVAQPATADEPTEA